MSKTFGQELVAARTMTKNGFQALLTEMRELNQAPKTSADLAYFKSERLQDIGALMGFAPWYLGAGNKILPRPDTAPLAAIVDSCISSLNESGLEVDSHNAQEVVEDTAATLGIELTEKTMLACCECVLQQVNAEPVLPFGIEVIQGGPGNVSLTSKIADEFKDDGHLDAAGKASADALESFLLAMASQGIDLTDYRIVTALEDAVGAIAQNLDADPENEIQDVVDHVLKMQENYGFQNDVESIREPVMESASLLGITLSEASIVTACDTILERQQLRNQEEVSRSPGM